MRFSVIGLVAFLAGLTTACAPTGERAQAPVTAEVTDAQTQGWRHANSVLHLSVEGPAPGAQAFRFSGLGAYRTTVSLVSLAPVRLQLEGRCDGPVTIETRVDGTRSEQRLGADEPFRLTLSARQRRGPELELAAATMACDLAVTPAGRAPYALRMEREERFAPEAVRRLDARTDTCAAPAAGSDPLVAVFSAPRALSMTCAFDPGATRLLADSIEAFQAKVEALTGARLPEQVLSSGNPDAPIDFSRAPELDMIFISSLQIRADFTGYLLARMLAFHAARGTTIRILGSENLLLGRDRGLLQSLAARYPNVQFQMYSWQGPRTEGDWLDRIQRSNHVKVFATLARAPGRSVFMVGGRNLHDGFVFEEPYDLSAWPFLHNYDPDAFMRSDFFVVYRDFEISMSGDAAVRAMVAHMFTLWHRDHDTQAIRPFSAGADARRGGASQGLGAARMRHFLSVPFSDGQALEALYVDLFDAARSRIDLVSPFLNLTPAIEAALERALDRGVAVTVLTRLRIPEPSSFLVSTLNGDFARRYGDRVAVYAHRFDLPTLHSKIIIIDERLSMVSSINLNQRSFIHDLENGVLLLDAAEARRLQQVLESYRADSTPLTSDQAVNRLVRAILRIGFLETRF